MALPASNRRLYKEIPSGQARPTWSFIAGVLSSSIHEGAYHAACYRTACCDSSPELAPRVPAGRFLPVQLRPDGASHRGPPQSDRWRDLRPPLHPGGDALDLLASNTQRCPSCRAAVARLSATRVAQGLAPCSPL